jgi:5-methylcytosine-specific restriction endonuclease McrA
MPRAPKKCGKDGCDERVPHGGIPRCPLHNTPRWPPTPPGGSRTTTPEHRAWRLAVLERDHWRCQLKYPPCTGKATEADHITPDTQGGALTLDNGQATCVACHRVKTAIEANNAQWGTHHPLPPPA